MATKIVTKNSSTASAVPTASDLVQGELAVNVADKRLFTEDNAGAIVELGTNPYNFTANHNGSAKLATTSTGIDVTGTATMDAATIQTASNEEDALLIKQSDGTDVGSLRINNGSFLLKGKSASQPVQIQSHDGNEDIEIDPDGFIKFETAGSERMRIDASGNVGIGTGLPSSPNDATTFVHIGNATNQDTSIVLQDAVETWEIYQNDDLSFLFDTTNVMTLQRLTGNVGIGTSSPSRQLEIYDDGTNGQAVLALTAQNTENSRIMFADPDDNNIGILDYSHADDSMRFTVNNSERMRIDSSGRVGIGRTPSISNSKLEVGGADNVSLINVEASGVTGGMGIGSTGLQFFHGSSAKMRIDASGNVGIGTTASNKLDIKGTVGFEATNSTNKWLAYHYTDNTLRFNYNGAGADELVIDSSGNVGIGTSSPTYNLNVVAGAGTQAIFQAGQSGVSNGYTINSNGTSLTHQWYKDGSEAARIDSSGNLLVGKTAINFTTVGAELRSNGQINSGSTADFLNMFSTSASAYRFYVTNAGTIKATNTTISAISDQRFKENIRDLDDGLSKVMELRPRKFDWKEGKGADIKDDRGFIAQEFEEVFPDLVGEWKDEAPEGEEPYKAVSQDLIPTLVKAIQEQQTLIESLTARIAAVEE